MKPVEGAVANDAVRVWENQEESKAIKRVSSGRGELQLSHSPLAQDGGGLSLNGYGRATITSSNRFTAVKKQVCLPHIFRPPAMNPL